MTRPIVRTAFATGAAAAAVVLAAAGASAQSPYDHVVGGGQNNPPRSDTKIEHFQINVKSGPNGENPQGSFSFKRTIDGPPKEEFTASVTCLRVEGNLATIVGLVTKTTNRPYEPGRYQLLRLKDVGQGNTSEDEVQSSLYTGDPYQCPPPSEPKPEEITKGNINIFDAL